MHVIYIQKNNKRIRKFKETGESRDSYQNILDEACFQQDMVYDDSKNLTRRNAFDNVSHDEAFNIAKIPKNDEY